MIIIISLIFFAPKAAVAQEHVPWWEFQSVDTMKYSRDTARENSSNTSFDATIDFQIKAIADLGATHVAIATPYDAEFIPFLKKWVSTARQYGLYVWFRGNFSGWEKWFDYPPITAEEHKTKTEQFILGHPDLFEEGDIFSSCPECENGNLGDPRLTRNVQGYRDFIISEYNVTQNAFAKINKKNIPNYFSMNGDIAKLIMDKETTQALGNIVVIDHYVPTSDRLVKDINSLADQSGGKIVLGEIGVPIPDINGNMTEEEQSMWLNDAFTKLTKIKSLIGVNYWVGFGGSTELWGEGGIPRPAIGIVHSYFSPKLLKGNVVNDLGRGISDVSVKSADKEIVTDNTGYFAIPYLSNKTLVQFSKQGYRSQEYVIGSQKEIKIYLKIIQENFLQKIIRQILSYIR